MRWTTLMMAERLETADEQRRRLLADLAHEVDED